jgi:hypothetical protein
MLPALVWEKGRKKELSRPFKVFYAKCPCGDGESDGITPAGRVDSNIFGLVGGSVLVLSLRRRRINYDACMALPSWTSTRYSTLVRRPARRSPWSDGPLVRQRVRKRAGCAGWMAAVVGLGQGGDVRRGTGKDGETGEVQFEVHKTCATRPEFHQTKRPSATLLYIQLANSCFSSDAAPAGPLPYLPKASSTPGYELPSL